MRDKVKRAVHWRNAKEALNLAANAESLAAFQGFSAETREMHKQNAIEFRAIAAAELRKIPAPYMGAKE